MRADVIGMVFHMTEVRADSIVSELAAAEIPAG
jgi:hypothetical protein